MTTEDKYYARREDSVENFLADDSSSDDNIDYNMVLGGNIFPVFSVFSEISVCVSVYSKMAFIRFILPKLLYELSLYMDLLLSIHVSV